MNPLGVHALVFVSGWSQEEADRAIGQAAECGYQYLEIPLINPRAINIKRTRKALDKAGLRPITSLGLGPKTDVSSDDPSHVSRGENLLGDALSVARDLGSTMLSGVLYSALGKYRTAASETGRWNCIQALRRLADRARDAGMTIGIEPVNRYESNLINTGDDALALIQSVGADNMVVHLDSYHMNIEEGDPGPLIQRLGNRLGYVHVNESHRGYLGTGSIDFDTLFQTLADHGYRGVITFEAFAAGIGDPKLNAELAVWRPLWDDADDLARHARNFMIEKMQAAQHRRQEKPISQPRQAESYDAVRPASEDRRSEKRSTSSERRRFGWSRSPA